MTLISIFISLLLLLHNITMFSISYHPGWSLLMNFSFYYSLTFTICWFIKTFVIIPIKKGKLERFKTLQNSCSLYKSKYETACTKVDSLENEAKTNLIEYCFLDKWNLEAYTFLKDMDDGIPDSLVQRAQNLFLYKDKDLIIKDAIAKELKKGIGGCDLSFKNLISKCLFEKS